MEARKVIGEMLTPAGVYHMFAADDIFKFCPWFKKVDKSWYFMWNICQQMIHMKHQALFTTKIKVIIKGVHATLMITMFYQKELFETWILVQVSSKSVEKWGSYGHKKKSIWPTFSCHFEYLISFQNYFNCLIFSYQHYHSICVSADMQLYT